MSSRVAEGLSVEPVRHLEANPSLCESAAVRSASLTLRGHHAMNGGDYEGVLQKKGTLRFTTLSTIFDTMARFVLIPFVYVQMA